jgi:hypothetical protein
LKNAKCNGRAVYSESQCGIDGRLLTPELAKLLKQAHFLNPRIAWDHGYSQRQMIKKQIEMLIEAGYRAKEMYVFMISNFEHDFYEMLQKIKECKKWGVQTADCRYRPLNQTFDNYNPRVAQTSADYFIHQNWMDWQVKLFRRKVREQNIVIRHGFESYNRELERLGRK